MPTPTPLPLDCPYCGSRERNVLRARVAELEAERESDQRRWSAVALEIYATAVMVRADAAVVTNQTMNEQHTIAAVKRLADDHYALMAHANALRDALEQQRGLKIGLPVNASDEAIAARLGRIAEWEELRDRLLAAHPAASLAAHDAEVLEPYLKALRSIAANTCCDGCQEAAWVAKSALAAQAQEVTK